MDDSKLVSAQVEFPKAENENMLDSEPVGQQKEQVPEKSLGVFQLAAITYFIISAGPYGIEETVKAVGPGWALIFIACVPIALSLPVSLISAQMSSFFPEIGSTILWAQQIVKNNQNVKTKTPMKILTRIYAMTMFAKGMFDLATYPVLISGYLESFFPQLSLWYFRLAVAFPAIVISVFLNLFGADLMGAAQYVFAFLILSPIVIFVLLSIIGGKWQVSKLSLANTPETPDWGLVVSNLIWQCSGFDKSSNFSGEVKNPRRTFPIAFFLVILMIIVTLLIPMMAGSMVDPNADNWSSGYIGELSRHLPGQEKVQWLYYWVVIAGAASCLSVQNVCLGCYCRELYTNTNYKLVPFMGWLAKLNKGLGKNSLIPLRAILVLAVLGFGLSALDFDTLIKMVSFCMSFAMIIQAGLYIYAKHGQYGFVRCNNINPDSDREHFHLSGGLITSLFMVVGPIGVSLFQIIGCGWVPLLIFLAIQTAYFVLYGFELLIQKIKYKSYVQIEARTRGSSLIVEIEQKNTQADNVEI